MATTSPIQFPVPNGDTPAPDPYRLATSAVRLPREATTAEHVAIRAEIEPRDRWWDFDFQPWHFWVAIAAAVGATGGFIGLIVTTGAIR